MGDFFGYHEPSALPTSLCPKDPSAYRPDMGSGPEYASPTKGPQPALSSPYQAGTKGVKPVTNQKRWLHTGLTAEFQLVSIEGEDLYKCPFPNCNFTPCRNIDTVVAHICCHLNLAISCHYCNKLFWGSEGWHRHCKNIHSSYPLVPAGYNTLKEPPKE